MKKLMLALGFSTLLSFQAYSCTDFFIQSADNSWINGRSMEFAAPLNATVDIEVQGKIWRSTAPGGSQGLAWQTHYGYVAVRGFGATCDGMNEQGLSVGALWLPTSQYETVPTGQDNRAILLDNVGDWLLGSFRTVAEVKRALATVYVWGQENPILKIVPPIHLTIHDKYGESIVVEFIKGKKVIYENKVKVLTNFPYFDWHVQNLSNYINLKPSNVDPVNYEGMVIAPTGQGSGMLGIPGDWTPPSRFVKTFVLKEFIQPQPTALDQANLAFHLLNTVDIPYGDVREGKDIEQGKTELTQWVVVKDLTNKIFYFRTYNNQNIYKIDFSKIDFNRDKKYNNITIDQPVNYVDVSNLFTPKM